MSSQSEAGQPLFLVQTLVKRIMQASRQALPRTLRAGSVRLPSPSLKTFSTSSSCCADPSPSSSGSNQKSTHFGFQSVPESIKESLVGKVFSSVASSYDVMVWRKKRLSLHGDRWVLTFWLAERCYVAWSTQTMEGSLCQEAGPAGRLAMSGRCRWNR